ncbi:MAG: helicase, partial [Prevotella oris]|nr:helicase [Segatella oris]
VKTESTSKDLFDCSVNRFFVKGQESIYYTYNNGKLATDPKLACENFLGALGRIPKVIESHEKEKEKVAANQEIYTAIANGTWKKEDELRSLKGQSAELDRKITLTITADKEGDEELSPKSDWQNPPDAVSEHSVKETIVRHKVRF